ncbi:hypothetical protein HG530_011699 [Fusarium avenaceum]|nr:hypothetical protein HG530_011699 [Fusarium avenaceum]
MTIFSIPIIIATFAVLAGLMAPRLRHVIRRDGSVKEQRIPPKSILHNNEVNESRLGVRRETSPDTVELDSLALYKELYHKVQNIQEFPDILPLARTTLVSLLSEAVKVGNSITARSTTILNIERYDSASLTSFLSDQHNATLHLYKDYTQRRAAGQPRELFPDRRSAIQWLIQTAPLKYVDGAWLGGIHKASTPFYLRRVTRLAWQVLSEELGDGDLSKHHVHLYRELLRSLDIHLPCADSAAFVSSDGASQGMEDPRVWKSAVAQLLISLFPNDLLPEILGFNLHFELLTNETLMVARELPELGIDGYYFTLHISIDNADSGHSAMALEAVKKYMRLIQEKNGPGKSTQDIWRRVQAGYLLSQTLGNDNPTVASTFHDFTLSPMEARVFDIIRLKATTSNKIHAACRARIGDMSLAEWLEPPPKAWGEKKWRRNFLNTLAKASPWVRPGESHRSLLVRELGWKGRMFGAFTQSETEDLCAWINGLSKEGLHIWAYKDVHSESKIEDSELLTDGPHAVAYLLPVSSENYVDGPPLTLVDQLSPIQPFVPLPPLRDARDINITRLLPLWFSHTALLENTVATPYRTATQLQSNILRLLRINSGFSPVENSIAGMDEDRGLTYSPDLIEIGLSMLRRAGLPEPTCLQDTLDWPSLSSETTFAYKVLNLAKGLRPELGIQIGLARAFLDLEDWVARQPNLLDERDSQALTEIVKRKTDCLVACLKELELDNIQYAHFVNGYFWGRNEVERLIFIY